jgi:4-hydroxythreonine-4-phosphate dehydrogenase
MATDAASSGPMTDLPRIALLMGDPNGVGPELAVKLLAMPEIYRRARVLVVAPPAVWEAGQRVAATSIDALPVDSIDRLAFVPGRPSLLPLPVIDGQAITVGRATPVAGGAVLRQLAFVADALAAGQVDGVVFAPLNKQAMRLAGLKQEDELEYVAEHLGVQEPVCELNMLDGLWTSRVTSHIALRRVADLITVDAVCTGAYVIEKSLRMSGVATPKIAVCALNPHAGDGGTMGREEIDVIAPAVARLQGEGIDARGPFPSDTAFLLARREGYDAVLTMYHDQGQIAMKTLGFERGVTVMGGLPYPVATPAQGTAFDIAGKGVANAEAIRRAFHVVADMSVRAQRAH